MAYPPSTTTTTSTLHTLHRASGSATYITPHSSSHHTSSSSSTTTTTTPPLTVTSAINFPLEIPRRSDELPSSLLIDVHLRPARGVGQVRERHVEKIVQRTLGAVIWREDWPRMMCQVGLQVVAGEEQEGGGSYLAMLAGCVNAAVLGCLDAGVPMREVLGAVLVGVVMEEEGGGVDGGGGSGGDGGMSVVLWPTERERGKCSSLHVFGFLRDGKCVLMETEGRCGIEEWERVEGVARRAVLGGTGVGRDGDVVMDGGDEAVPEPSGGSVMASLRKAVEERVARDESWRG